VATQSLTDDNAGNNQRSATVNVVPAPADIALASITGPGSVTVGDTAPVVVTVRNVGGQDVTANFDVVLTDGAAGNAVIGTQTIPGLALGASATTTFNWNTAGATIAGHILTATQKYPDANASNNASAIVVSVTAPSVHVGNLDGFPTSGVDTWSAAVRITAHDSRHTPVNGVTVRASWNSGPEVQCVTADADGIGPGTCTLTLAAIPNATRSAYFGINGLTMAGYTYKPALNHDPDGSSNGFSLCEALCWDAGRGRTCRRWLPARWPVRARNTVARGRKSGDRRAAVHRSIDQRRGTPTQMKTPGVGIAIGLCGQRAKAS
jgi:hypothetical protein